MFTRSLLGNQFQPFAYGASPFAGVGGVPPFPSQVVGYNPLLSVLTPQVSAMGALGGYNPILPQIGTHGFNPYQPYGTAQLTGGVHVPPAHLWAGFNPVINPQIAAQLPGINPGILPNVMPQVWGGPFGQHISPGMINPLFQPVGSEIGFLGQTPFGQLQTPFGQLQTPFGQPQTPFGQPWTGGLHTLAPYHGQFSPYFSPYVAQDPIATSMLAQQLNPLAQQRLPIRPLTGMQQVDPFQVGLSGVTGFPISQMMDPYSALTQAQLMSQYGINPIQQMARAYNWPGSPYSIGQTPPINPIGAPF